MLDITGGGLIRSLHHHRSGRLIGRAAIEGVGRVDRFGLSLEEQERVWELRRSGLSLRAVARERCRGE